MPIEASSGPHTPSSASNSVGLDRHEVEQAISQGHDTREVNDGRAQWLVRGTTADGTSFEAIYDHPHGGDVEAVRIVSVWRLL
jgi:hypothetical protein